MKVRAREIAEPRRARQESLAKNLALGGSLVAAVLAFWAAWDVAPAVTLILVALAAAVTSSIAGYPVALFFVAPLLVRWTPAPPPKPASELLRLGDQVPADLSPSRPTRRLPSPFRAPSTRRPRSSPGCCGAIS
jgi:hypothetical protein